MSKKQDIKCSGTLTSPIMSSSLDFVFKKMSLESPYDLQRKSSEIWKKCFKDRRPKHSEKASFYIIRFCNKSQSKICGFGRLLQLLSVSFSS